MNSIVNTLLLAVKELRSIRSDKVMIFLIFYVFTVATYVVADAISTEVVNLSTVVVDEDHSTLSQRLTQTIRGPLFKAPDEVSAKAAESGLTYGDYVLSVTIPPNFERDLRSGKNATLSIEADATAIALAGNGATFMQQLIADEVTKYFARGSGTASLVNVVFHNQFNPNLTSKWFSSVMQLMNSVTIITLILSGASMIRERERGTIEHVLVMPVRPHEIVFSKILANGAVILVSAILSLIFVVNLLIGVPINGSLLLFTAGTALYVISVASLGLMLASFTHSMGQFGLLAIPAIIVMILLSGGMTPLESMPGWLQGLMTAISPAMHFVRFTQSVLYRGSGLDLVAGEMLAMALMASAALGIVLARFRKVLAG